MNYLKSKYINHLTPGLIFKADYEYQLIYCVVNNKGVLCTLYSDNVVVYTHDQNLFPWAENGYKLELADKELLDRFKL